MPIMLPVAWEQGCKFCEIIKGERSAEIVHQDETLIVFHDIRPAASVHLLIVPKKHIRSINDLVDEDRDIVGAMILKARDMAKEFSVADSGYRLFFNVERGAGQVIFHLHMHLVGGWVR
jgi:histidine triad (HIT) family protein